MNTFQLQKAHTDHYGTNTFAENTSASAEGASGTKDKVQDAMRAEALDRRIIRAKLESWRIQLKECQATERQRIVFGKVLLIFCA